MSSTVLVQKKSKVQELIEKLINEITAGPGRGPVNDQQDLGPQHGADDSAVQPLAG
jgi:hypothetical protein